MSIRIATLFILLFTTLISLKGWTSSKQFSFCTPKLDGHSYDNKGFMVDGPYFHVINKIYKEVGIDISIRMLPVLRCYRKMELGEYDGVLLTAKNDFTSAIVEFGSVTIYSDKVILLHQNKEFVYSSIESLRNRKVGAILGTATGKLADIAHIEYTPYGHHAIKKVKHGRLEFALWSTINIGGTEYMNEEEEIRDILPNLIISKGDFKPIPVVNGFSKISPILKYLPQINKASKKYEKDLWRATAEHYNITLTKTL